MRDMQVHEIEHLRIRAEWLEGEVARLQNIISTQADKLAAARMAHVPVEDDDEELVQWDDPDIWPAGA